MPDETNQAAEAEANQSVNPDTGNVEEPETTGGEESELSAEQIAELKALRQAMTEANITDAKAFMSDYTRKSQALSEAERYKQQWDYEKAQLQGTIGQLTGTMKAQTDPVEAARQNYLQALSNYDPEEIARANDAYMAAKLQAEKKSWLTEAQNAARVQSRFEEAKRILGVDDDQQAALKLQQIATGMAQDPVGLAKLARVADGSYTDWAMQQQNAAEAKAKQADLLKSLGSAGGRGVPSGTGNTNAPAPTAEQWNFDMWNPKKKADWLKAGGKVVDSFGEDVTPSYAKR